MMGASVRKATSLGTNLEGAETFHGLRCEHPFRHEAQVGWDAERQVYRTAQLAEYPPQFCRWLAALFIQAFLDSGSALSSKSMPDPYRGLAALSSRGEPLPFPSPPLRNIWPQPGRAVLAELLHGRDKGSVIGRPPGL